jgi:uncharacterized membrane-anchored protein YitT (DUF2179 family)
MTHREKVARLVQELTQKGVNQYSTAPPLFRFLWATGLEIPPPFFIRFVPLMLFMAVSFGIFAGLFMWLLTRWTFNIPTESLIVVAAAGGLLFGLFMAAYSRWKARRLGLPTWSEYGEA